MEVCIFIVIFSLCLPFIFKVIRSLVRLPPGPPRLPIIGSFTLLHQYFRDPQTSLRNLHAKYGPIFSIHMGSQPSIYIADGFLAHQALIQKGAVFADRPKALPTVKVISSNQHDILFSFYGPTWRLLRRNLTSQILHPSRLKSYAHARKWVLDMLLNRLKSYSDSKINPTTLLHHFQYAMFCLLVLMCLGHKLEERQIREIEESQRRMLLRFTRYNFLNFLPQVTKILFRKRWQEYLQFWEQQKAVLIPHISALKKIKEERLSKGKAENDDPDDDQFVLSYLDTLLDLQLPEDGNRNLDDGEICTLCSEFLNAGTDTTSTALEWVMANLVKYPHIQQKLVQEIRKVVGEREDKEVKEEDLNELAYLKAVILESLRRHPPLHYVAPHRVTEDVVLNGYLVPTNSSVNFLLAEIGRDPTVWEDPMAFKPERFLNNAAFDIMGSKEIKMMPFGAGRRMCPGYGLALLHLEYFAANLVWNFEWKAMDGDDVDMSEKLLFTMVMKNPLKAHLSPRRR